MIFKMWIKAQESLENKCIINYNEYIKEKKYFLITFDIID